MISYDLLRETNENLQQSYHETVKPAFIHGHKVEFLVEKHRQKLLWFSLLRYF